MSLLINDIYRFDEFELVPSRRAFSRLGTQLPLSPKAFEVLTHLVINPGRVVTKEEIFKAVWPESFVEESNLSQHVSALRKALGDRSSYIVTIPGRGYQFTARVEVASPADEPAQREEAGETLIQRVRERTQVVVEESSSDPVAESKSSHSSLARRLPRFAILCFLSGTVAVILGALGFGWYKWSHEASAISAPAERQFTANPKEDWVSAAAISPDGKYVAYIDQTGLFVRSVDSGEIRPIVLPADFPAKQIWSLLWFPDGGKLLVTRVPKVSEGPSIWTVAILGAVSAKKLRQEAFDAAISPDGKSIVFLSGMFAPGKEIWVSGANGESPRKLVSSEQGQAFESPVWSPDSKWIAYFNAPVEHESTAAQSIEIRSASGGPPKTLVPKSNLPSSETLNACAWWGCLCWRPNWNLVYSIEDDSGASSESSNISLWQMHVEPDRNPISQPPRQIARWADFRWAEFYSGNMTTTADGKILAFTKSRDNQDIYVGELDSGSDNLKNPRRLTLDSHDSYPETWMKDKQTLLLGSNRNGKEELFTQGLNDVVAEKVVSPTAGAIGYYNGLSPDGSWILYWEYGPVGDKAQRTWARMMRQPTGSGSPETVFEVPYSEGKFDDFSCPQKPNRSCVLSKTEGETLLFYAFDPIRGKGDQLGKIAVDTNSYFGWAVSPDGSQLAVVDYSHKDRIEILSLSEHDWHEIVMEPGWGLNQSIAWAADGKSWFVTTWLPESFNLIHIAASGKVRPLLTNARRQWMYKPLPSPDGKYLAFQAQTWDSNVWLLENF